MKLTYPLFVATAASAACVPSSANSVSTPAAVAAAAASSTAASSSAPLWSGNGTTAAAPTAYGAATSSANVSSSGCVSTSTNTTIVSVTVYSSVSTPAAASTVVPSASVSQQPPAYQSYAAAPSSGQSSAAATPSATSSAAATNGNAGTASLPLNKQYSADVNATINILAPSYSSSSLGWKEIGGYKAATTYQDMMDYVYWTGDKSQKVYGDDLLRMVNSQDLLNGAQALDDFNDDQGWWILAFLHAYRTYGDAQFLTQATNQFNKIVATSQLSASDAGSKPNKGGLARTVQIPGSCDVEGGVYWRQTPDANITAISTGLVAQIGSILYGITKQESFRTAADLAVNYERRELMDNSTGIMTVDAVQLPECKKDLGSLCYNTGVYIDALTRLYEATGESQYLDWAVLTVTSSVTGAFGNQSSAPLVLDQADWSYDAFFSAITEFYVMLQSKNLETDLQQKIKTFIKANTDYVLAHGKQGNNYYSEQWLDNTEGTAWGTASVLSLYMAAAIML